MSNGIRRDIEDECGILADRAQQNNDKPLEAVLLAVRAISSMPPEHRDQMLAKFAMIGGILIDKID